MTAGRPTKKTPETLAKLEEALRLGLTYDQSAHVARIHPDTFREWRQNPEFSAECQAWMADGVFVHAKNVARCADDADATNTNLRASSYYLSTRRSGQWVEQKAVEHSGGLDLASAVSAITDIETAAGEGDES